MRKIIVSELLSLDGVAEAPDKFLTDWDDDVMDARMSAVIDTQDAVILGRRSYDEWVRFWPESTIEPYATFINAVAKFVVTSTPLDRHCRRSTLTPPRYGSDGGGRRRPEGIQARAHFRVSDSGM